MILYAFNTLKLNNFLSVTFGAEVTGRPKPRGVRDAAVSASPLTTNPKRDQSRSSGLQASLIHGGRPLAYPARSF
jgi:hypothetical protein